MAEAILKGQHDPASDPTFCDMSDRPAKLTPNIIGQRGGLRVAAANPGLALGHVMIVPTQPYNTAADMPVEDLHKLDSLAQELAYCVARLWRGAEVVVGFEHGSPNLQQILHAHQQLVPVGRDQPGELARRVAAEIPIVSHAVPERFQQEAYPTLAVGYAAVTDWGSGTSAHPARSYFNPAPLGKQPGYIRVHLARIIGKPQLGNSSAILNAKEGDPLWALKQECNELAARTKVGLTPHIEGIFDVARIGA
jgi:diadenosine tetraphosphate (Ap4A) HIT family hydrolase